MYYEILQTVQTMKKYLIKKSQKIADILIEDSHPYIAELVENIPKYRISGKKYRPISVGGLDSFHVHIGAMEIKIM